MNTFNSNPRKGNPMETPYRYDKPPSWCSDHKKFWINQHAKRQILDYRYACLVEKREAAEKKRAEANK